MSFYIFFVFPIVQFLQVELKERAEMEFLVVQDPDEQEEAEDDEEENSQSSPVHAATAAEAASVKVIDDGFGDDKEARLAEKRFKQLVKKRARIRKEGRGEVHGPSLAGSRAYKEEVQRARYRVDHDNNVSAHVYRGDSVCMMRNVSTHKL